MKCISCGMSIPEMPEDATYDELLCDSCYARWERHQEEDDKPENAETGGVA